MIGLCPSFAFLMHANRKSTKKRAGGYVKQDRGSFNLRTIGSASTRTKNKALDDLEIFESGVYGSQDDLAGKQDCISISTTAQQDEGGLIVA